MPSGKPGPGLGRVANRSTPPSRSSPSSSCAVAEGTAPPSHSRVIRVRSSVGSQRGDMVYALRAELQNW